MELYLRRTLVRSEIYLGFFQSGDLSEGYWRGRQQQRNKIKDLTTYGTYTGIYKLTGKAFTGVLSMIRN
jgi:hypothetical protein